MQIEATGPKRLREWRARNRVTLADLGDRVGDPGGHQIRKYETNRRRQLPLPIAIAVSSVTELRLSVLLTEDQMDLLRAGATLIARDAVAA